MLACRLLGAWLFLGTLAACSGCRFVPTSQLDALRAHNQLLSARSREQAVQIENIRIHSRNIEDQLMRTEEELALLEDQAGLDRRRVDNYRAERDQLRGQFLGLVQGGWRASPQVKGRLAEISQRCPNLKFDPQTGVSKLDADLLFDEGNAELRPEAEEVLRELTRVLKAPEGQDLRVLVVGHTDDPLIGNDSAGRKHANDFRLSADRGLSVCDALGRLGLEPERMGVAGFGPHQPVAPSRTGEGRQENRRVELFVMAPDVPVIGWTETTPTLY